MSHTQTIHPDRQHPRAIMPLLALLLFIVSQAFGVLHLSEHTAAGGNDHCEICDAALHLGNAPLPEAPQLALAEPAAQSAAECVASFFYRSHPAHYASRAPPAYS